MSIGFENHIFVCENARPTGHPRGCCASKGAGEVRLWFRELLEERGLDMQNRVNSAGCLAYCGAGPVVVVYPRGTWYRPQTREDVQEIIESDIIGSKPVDRLLIENLMG